eukprot:6183533-Pleurochrysis_carterae.AAC.6
MRVWSARAHRDHLGEKACIIPAVTAAVTRMTFVIRDGMGQILTVSRMGDSSGVRRGMSLLEATGASGASQALSDGSSFKSELNEPDGSSSSGCIGRRSGKRSSAYRS